MAETGFMTMGEAEQYLEVSHWKLTRFIKQGLLTCELDLFDQKRKLIPVEQVKALAARRVAKNRAQAA